MVLVHMHIFKCQFYFIFNSFCGFAFFLWIPLSFCKNIDLIYSMAHLGPFLIIVLSHSLYYTDVFISYNTGCHHCLTWCGFFLSLCWEKEPWYRKYIKCLHPEAPFMLGLIKWQHFAEGQQSYQILGNFQKNLNISIYM